MAEHSSKARKMAKRKKANDMMNHAQPAKPQASDLIGRRLRSYYDDIARQPVPGRFLDLLSQLEANDPPKKPQKG